MHETSFVEALDVRVAASTVAERVQRFVSSVRDCSHMIFVSVHPAIFGTARISLDRQKLSTYKFVT